MMGRSPTLSLFDDFENYLLVSPLLQISPFHDFIATDRRRQFAHLPCAAHEYHPFLRPSWAFLSSPFSFFLQSLLPWTLGPALYLPLLGIIPIRFKSLSTRLTYSVRDLSFSYVLFLCISSLGNGNLQKVSPFRSRRALLHLILWSSFPLFFFKTELVLFLFMGLLRSDVFSEQSNRL